MLAAHPRSRALLDVHREALRVIPRSCHSPPAAPGTLQPLAGSLVSEQ
jgi:hypothetical protein